MICAMSVAELPIQIDHQKIAEFCRVRGIRKLSLFGSVLREDFNPDRSDVDVLAEFEPGALKGVGFRYFGQDRYSYQNGTKNLERQLATSGPTVALEWGGTGFERFLLEGWIETQRQDGQVTRTIPNVSLKVNFTI